MDSGQSLNHSTTVGESCSFLVVPDCIHGHPWVVWVNHGITNTMNTRDSPWFNKNTVRLVTAYSIWKLSFSSSYSIWKSSFRSSYSIWESSFRSSCSIRKSSIWFASSIWKFLWHLLLGLLAASEHLLLSWKSCLRSASACGYLF